jgi:S-DNA-T family DNA segregation ATPase FtsK/SpoIIIE
VEGVRRIRYALKTLFLRARIHQLGRLYPEHTALKALAKTLSPEELPEVEKALKAFLEERARELEKRLAEEARPLEPRLQALLQALKNPIPGEGPLRDALEERRAALHLEAQALMARLKRLQDPPKVTPSLRGLLKGRRLLEERRALWEEAAGLLQDLEARQGELARFFSYLEASPQVAKEALRALLTGSEPPTIPKAEAPPPEPEAPEPFDLDLVFPNPSLGPRRPSPGARRLPPPWPAWPCPRRTSWTPPSPRPRAGPWKRRRRGCGRPSPKP